MLLRLACFLGLAAAFSAGAATAQSVVFTSDTYISSTDTQYDNWAVTVRGCTLTIDGGHVFQSLLVERNAGNVAGVVTHTAGFTAAAGDGLRLTITGALTVQGASGALVASRIDVSDRGYAQGQGPGTPPSGSGATAGGGHGGRGGSGANQAGGTCYEAVLAPATLGSGAGITYGYGPAGSGGGAVHLVVNGVATLDGEVRADGGTPSAGSWGGGGSGGSIWLRAGTWTGSGLVSASGGAAGLLSHGGGGGGGRVALLSATATFTGSLVAVGGSGLQRGGAGTIYQRRDAEAFGQLRIDNGGAIGAITELNSAFWPATTLALSVAGSALAHPYGAPLTVQSLTLATGAVLSHDAGQAGIDLTVSGDLTLDGQSRIDATGRGFPEGQGPGTPVSGNGATGGGGHGGRGGNGLSQVGGLCYELLAAPVQPGSGAGITYGYGGAGSGGGAVRLQVGGVLTVDGQILVTGGSAPATTWGGGGSGGSLWITAGSFAGSGSLVADGGAAGNTTHGGGGGGGRIAITSAVNTFAGTLSATGGSGSQRGGAGTIFVKRDSAAFGQVRIDNGGQPGALTELNAAFWPGSTFALTLAGNALAHPYGAPLTFESLLLTTGAVVSHDAAQTLLDITVRGDLAIDALSRIDVNGRGFPEGQGPGTPPAGSGATGGAGHGGRGGNGANSIGGICHELITFPFALGSGAGVTYGYGPAGVGGGAVRLLVFGTLTVDGAITARGGDAPAGSWGGGGAGGSVLLMLNRFAGSGTVASDGGHAGLGAGYGGGGGGGRIAVHSLNQGFTGTFSARGGTGAQAGGAGTLWLHNWLAPWGTLTVDNGGLAGASTELRTSFWATSDLVALVARGAARLDPYGSVSLVSIAATTGAQFGHVPLGVFDVVVWGDASFDATTSITADLMGFTEGQGPGTPAVLSGATGGGGHGGRGGAGQNGSGGPRYGSVTAPTTLGSGGGITYGYGGAGTGGGAIRLHVGGALALDGQITARGGNGSAGGWGGGGSGGSVYLAAGHLSGGGLVNVDGGNAGHSGYGGGGGGGRIAVYYLTQSFAGQLSALGGTGWRNGESGMVYLRQGIAPTWNQVRNGNFELGALAPWDSTGGGGNAQLEVFDVTGLGATTALGVDATSVPQVLSQSVTLAAGTRYWLAADFAGYNGGTGADSDAGQWEIRVDGVLVKSGGLGGAAAGQTVRRRACTLFTPGNSGPLTLELRLFRTSAGAGVRTYVDNVEILPASTPVSCVEDARRIGTTIAWNVVGTPRNAFVIWLSGSLLDGGVTVAGASGVWYLSPVVMLPVFSGALDGAGVWQTSVTLPNDPSLVRAPLWFQGLEVDVGSGRTAIGLVQGYPLIGP